MTALALVLLSPSAVAADTLDVKEGLWEATSTMVIEGLQLPSMGMSGRRQR